MNQQFPHKAFAKTAILFSNPGTFQAIAEKTAATSKEYFDNAAAAAQDGTKVLTELTDAAWGNTKALNEMVVQNVAANISAIFTAAHDMTTVKSMPEIGNIQREFAQKFAAQATKQTKEFVELSTRATRDLLERAAAATKS